MIVSEFGKKLIPCLIIVAAAALLLDDRVKDAATDPWFDTIGAVLAIFAIFFAIYEARNPEQSNVRLLAVALLTAVSVFAAIVSAAVESAGSLLHAVVIVGAAAIAVGVAMHFDQQPPPNPPDTIGGGPPTGPSPPAAG